MLELTGIPCAVPALSFGLEKHQSPVSIASRRPNLRRKDCGEMCKSRTAETGQVPSLQLTAAGHELVRRCWANSPFPRTSEGSEDPQGPAYPRLRIVSEGRSAGGMACMVYVLKAADVVRLPWRYGDGLRIFALSSVMAFAVLVQTHGMEAISRVCCSSQSDHTGKLPRRTSWKCQPLPPGGPCDSEVAVCLETPEHTVTASGTTPHPEKVHLSLNRSGL